MLDTKVKDVTQLLDLSVSIDRNTAALQMKTCIQMIDMLKKVPGIILGDDVGMGKTYIAFSTAVWFLVNNPNKPIVIITPSWLLNAKWHNDIRNIIERNLYFDHVELSESDVVMIQERNGTYMNQIAVAANKAKVILIPMNVFASGGWKREKSFFLSCWFKHKRFGDRKRETILKALNGEKNLLEPEEFTNMGITYQEISASFYEILDQIYQEEGLSHAGVRSLKKAIKEFRYKAINKVMPRSSLLILDEAHKMKNPETVKRKALEKAVFHKFEKGIFLTATPFQLSEGELRSVLNMFKSAVLYKNKMKDFEMLISNMYFEMNKYQELMHTFEYYIQTMSSDEGIQLENVIQSGMIENVGYDVIETYDLYKRLTEQKNILESNMKKLIIRNVKKKNEYRQEIIGSLQNEDKVGIPLTNESYIPFAIMEKAIYQILSQGDKTFIANVKKTFTSSYEAVKNASIYKKDLEAIEMLSEIKLDKIKHPKLNAVTNEVVTTLQSGEKTLLFCGRIETIKQLKTNIEKRLNFSYNKNIKKVFPESGIKGFENYCKRFYNKQDVSWLLLQESYIHSVLVPILKRCGKNMRSIPKANQISGEVIKTYRKYNSTVKANYMYIKRIVEQIVFREALQKANGWESMLHHNPELLDTVTHILHPNYIELGLNPQKDVDEETLSEDVGTEHRNISTKLIQTVINYKGIWHLYQENLNKLPPVDRDGILTSMIHFLRRDKRFFIKLRSLKEKYPDKDDSFLVEKTFRKGNILDWENAFQRFLTKYCNETAANREEMQLGLSSSDVVAIITGGTKNDTRMKIRAGFNTPFYPQILIATAIMQEGIDLQVECRRVIHYDLEWNPASMEQKVGRIDRIGSLTSTLREKQQDITLDVFYPYIKNTIDESIYKTVKDREKWFNLILGGTPQWDTFEIDPEVNNIKPWVFKKLQINLSVD
ncbi:helicase-related protein [Bacillus sp. SCS-151]|uniref:helicase-related protein n=1 Tax=Nanhaiella sioensis TaxID=3115293 RepID=UPI00397DFA6B